jgi:hypothetical protein
MKHDFHIHNITWCLGIEVLKIKLHQTMYTKHLAPPLYRYLNPGQNVTRAAFAIPMSACGTALTALPDPQLNGILSSLIPLPSSSQMATVISNTIIIQMDPEVQEVWDSARKINCEWTSLVQKRVQFEPFEVQMLDYEEVRFEGDSVVDCWMDLQVGKFPDSEEVTAAVRIGQPLSMLVYAKDDEGKQTANTQIKIFWNQLSKCHILNSALGRLSGTRTFVVE